MESRIWLLDGLNGWSCYATRSSELAKVPLKFSSSVILCSSPCFYFSMNGRSRVTFVWSELRMQRGSGRSFAHSAPSLWSIVLIQSGLRCMWEFRAFKAFALSFVEWNGSQNGNLCYVRFLAVSFTNCWIGWLSCGERSPNDGSKD